MAISQLPEAPSLTDPAGFPSEADAFVAALAQFRDEANALAAGMNAAATGMPLAMAYNFDTTTAAADPGNGKLRFNNAAFASITAIYIDLVDAVGVTQTPILDMFDDSTSTIKGFLRIAKASDQTNFVVLALSSQTSPAGYRSIVVGYYSSNGAMFANTDALTFSFTRTGDKGDTGAAGAAGSGANVVINGDFRINQREYVSAAALAAGVYGHDRWKAGASGGNYSFTQLDGPTQITIAANKSIIQVIESKNVEGGQYTLSWEGTAVGRLTINNATPSGNFAVSPITVSGQTLGTTMSLELTGANAVGGSTIATNTGTVGKVKLELGATANAFVPDNISVGLMKCQRYFYRYAPANGRFMCIGTAYLATTLYGEIFFPTEMKSDPTMTVQNNAGVWYSAAGAVNVTLVVTGDNTKNSASLSFTTTGATLGASGVLGVAAGLIKCSFEAEL